jgi:hypothetical protein
MSIHGRSFIGTGRDGIFSSRSLTEYVPSRPDINRTGQDGVALVAISTENAYLPTYVEGRVIDNLIAWAVVRKVM